MASLLLGPSLILPVVMTIGIATGFAGSSSVTRARLWAMPLMILILVVMFVAQVLQPGLLTLFARDSAQIAHGQLWRSVSALFVQDGGWVGTLSHLAWLAPLGGVAERKWGAQWLFVYFLGDIVTEFLAFAWQPHGAGNSISCLALAGAPTTDFGGEGQSVLRICLAMFGVGAAIVLLASHDIHGIAYTIGLLLGVLIAFQKHRANAELTHIL